MNCVYDYVLGKRKEKGRKMTWVDIVYLVAMLFATIGAIQGVVFNSFRWHRPDNAKKMQWSQPTVEFDPGTSPSLTLLVPARHEQAVLANTLIQLCKQNYPNLVVMPIIGHDDEETLAAAKSVQYLYPKIIQIVMDYSWPKNKPRALNSALEKIETDLFGIIDAEDDVVPGLCERVVTEFMADEKVDVVQGGVHLVNLDGPWFAGRNAVEYLLWYASRLPFQAELGFLPLGGNTCFFRTSIVREVGGWDPDALAEDADIGVRIAVNGAKVVVKYDGVFATREECPESTTALYKQRVRWYQGFFQIIRKRDWRMLSLGRQLLALVTLLTPILQFLSALVLPGLLLYIGFSQTTPVDLVLLAFVPLFVEMAALVLEIDAISRLRRLESKRIRVKDLLLIVLSVIPYQLVMGAALFGALVRELSGNRSWTKTVHHGAHRIQPAYIDLRDTSGPVREPDYFPAAGK